MSLERQISKVTDPVSLAKKELQVATQNLSQQFNPFPSQGQPTNIATNKLPVAKRDRMDSVPSSDQTSFYSLIKAHENGPLIQDNAKLQDQQEPGSPQQMAATTPMMKHVIKRINSVGPNEKNQVSPESIILSPAGRELAKRFSSVNVPKNI